MAAESNNRGPQLLAVNFLFLFMAVIATALRCYTRIFIVKSFGVDDYLMVVATVSEPAADLRRAVYLLVLVGNYRPYSSFTFPSPKMV